MNLNSKTAYIIEFKLQDGTTVLDSVHGAEYDSENNLVSFWCGRSRIMNVIEIIKDDKNSFEFKTNNGMTVALTVVTAELYGKHKEELFYNAPTLKTDEGVQGYLMEECKF